jgi:hypothetical protein
MMAGTFLWKAPQWKNWKDYAIIASQPIFPAPQFANPRESSASNPDNVENCQDALAIDCGFSSECANMVLNRSETFNTLSHNVMFLNVAEKLNCIRDSDYLAKFPNGDWESVREEHCGKVWMEANQIFLAGFPAGYKRLFNPQGKSETENYVKFPLYKTAANWFL